MPPRFSGFAARLIRLLGLAVACIALPLLGLADTRYVEGEVIVTFKSGVSASTASTRLEKSSVTFVRRFESLSDRRKKQTGLVRDESRTTAALIDELSKDPEVETVEPNYIRWLNATPDDARFAEQWALQNTGQAVNGTSGTADADVKFLAARALGRTPEDEIVVGVIDTGVDHVHPDLAANVWVNPGEIAANGIDDDGNGYIDDLHGYDFVDTDADPSDSGEHGTHVAGTIAAVGDNQAGVIGVGGRTRLLALKVSADGDTITSAAAIEALQYATALKKRGVNVVALNASYGGGGYSSSEHAAIQAAGDAGILLCAAAGNESANNDTTPTYPASYRLANMIVVAASTQTDELASYSNRGATTVDLAAPGSNILSTRPATITFQAGGVTYASTAMTFSGTTTGLTGEIIDCGIGNPADFPAAVAGQIALIQRGTLTFSDKVANAMTAGARAAIIYNNTSGDFSGTLQTAGNWIPARSISQTNGLAIKAALPKSGAIIVTGDYQFLSGTSMATPHVAGAVAFAATNFPDDTLAQRRARVLAGVDAKSTLAGKVITGGRLNLLRIVDANQNGYADWRETTPVVTTDSLPLAINGEAYSATLEATGGVAPLGWTLSAGTLPPGIALSGSGELHGTSGDTATYVFTVRVTDQLGATATRELVLQTAATGPLDHFTWSHVPATAYAGTAFAIRFSARDAGERLITTLDGAVTLSSASAVSPASVLLTGGEFIGRVAIDQPSAGATLTALQGSVASASDVIMIQSGVSSANDGLPDAWKTAHGLDAGADLSTHDSDGDGADDVDEFVAGTDPLDAVSQLKISSTTLVEGSRLEISFPAVAGKLYRVRESEDLINWTTAEDLVLATADGTRSAEIPLDGRPRVFVRVEIAP